MNTLQFVLFQGMLSTLLSVPSHSKTMPPTMSEIMNTLGSMYQDKLFNYGPGFTSIKHRGNDLPDGEPEVTEISVEKLCLKNYPFCMTFEGTLTISENDVMPFLMEKPTEVQSCYSDFKFSDCKISVLGLPHEKTLDFSNVQVNDFCVPGTVEFEGSVSVLKELRANDNVFLIFLKNGDVSTMKEKYSLGSKCSPNWDYCNKFTLDEFLQGNPACRLWGELPTLPCRSPIKENVYSLSSFRMNVLEDFFQDTDIKSGKISSRILLFGKHGMESCVEMTFNRTVY